MIPPRDFERRSIMVRTAGLEPRKPITATDFKAIGASRVFA